MKSTPDKDTPPEKPKRGGWRPGAGRPKKPLIEDLRALPPEFAGMHRDEVCRRRDFWQGERNKESAEAKRLENARTRGELVEASAAASEMRACGLAVRQALEAAAEQRHADLHALTGAPLHECRAWLLGFVRQALTGVADDLG